MKLAKATQEDIDCAMKIAHALDAIGNQWGPTLPADLCDDPDDPDEFDIQDLTDCQRVVMHLLELSDCSRLNRVVMGMAVLMDPDNKLVNRDADHLDFHPEIRAMREAGCQ